MPAPRRKKTDRPVETTLEIPYKYKPREYQLPFWKAMLSGIRYAALVWHRRAGKDASAWNWMIYSAALIRPGVYYYLGPTYAQMKKIVWDGIDAKGMKVTDYVPHELILNRNETEMKLTIQCLKGGESIIQIVGTDKIDSVVGTNPVGCIFSEYALQSPMAWDLIRPILRENRGWAVFAYTPRGKNHGFRLFENAKNHPAWYTSRLTVNDTFREDGTRVFSDEDIEDERKTGMDEELIQQEYYTSFTGSTTGSYYGKLLDIAESEGRIIKVPYEIDLPVDTWWDLGIDDATAIWFSQSYGRELRFIDYFENTGEGLPYYLKLLKDKPYIYNYHIGPHDLKVRDYSTGTQRIQAARQLGLNFTVAPKLSPDDGIDAVRRLLPRCWFDAENCMRGLDALRSYHKEKDELLGTFKRTPVHDWSSHAADAFRTGAVGRREAPLDSQGSIRSDTSFDVFDYETDNKSGNKLYADTGYDPMREEFY